MAFTGLVLIVLGHCYRSGRLEFLTLDRQVTIEVNGVRVDGELLGGIRRDAGQLALADCG